MSVLEMLTEATEHFGSILTVNEASKISRRTPRQIRRWVAQGKLHPAKGQGGRVLIMKRELLELLAA